MNFKLRALVCALGLGMTTCEITPEVEVPQFTDGGLLRIGTPLARAQLMMFEGMFDTNSGNDVFGDQMAVRTSIGTVSLLTDKNAGFSVLQAACLPDRRVVLEGYWQYPTQTETGLVRLFVESESDDVAGRLCDGEVPTPDANLKLSGVFGNGNEFPDQPFVLKWNRELKPFRHTFFTVAHHGACEITDHCGASPNSIETIRLAERMGSNAAEIDVRATRDGIPVLFHDPGLSGALVKGTFCHGAVADLSLAELTASCRMQYGEKIPTVQEMMNFLVDETEIEGVYLDMKETAAVLPSAKIASATIKMLRDRNEGLLEEDQRRFVPLVAIPTEEVLAAWHDTKVALTAEGLEIPPCILEYDPQVVIDEECRAWGPTWTKGPLVSDVRKVQDSGRAVIFWTINQSEFIDQFLIDARPNGIISARAALLFYRYQTLGTPPMGVEP